MNARTNRAVIGCAVALLASGCLEVSGQSEMGAAIPLVPHGKIHWRQDPKSLREILGARATQTDESDGRVFSVSEDDPVLPGLDPRATKIQRIRYFFWPVKEAMAGNRPDSDSLVEISFSLSETGAFGKTKDWIEKAIGRPTFNYKVKTSIGETQFLDVWWIESSKTLVELSMTGGAAGPYYSLALKSDPEKALFSEHRTRAEKR